MNTQKDEWTTIGKKKKSNKAVPNIRKGLNREKKTLPTHFRVSNIVGDVRVAIQESKVQLRSTKFYQSICSDISNLGVVPNRSMCFGVGNFTLDAASLLQFVFFICFNEDVVRRDSSSVLSIYDPMFNEEEVNICLENGLTVSHENLNGKVNSSDGGKDINEATVYFMPHCPHSLYCSVLWSCWHVLSNTIIIGNSFDSYDCRRIESLQVDPADCMKSLLPLVTEVPLKVEESGTIRKIGHMMHLENAFNDTSIHYFLSDTLKSPLGMSILSNRPSEKAIDEANSRDMELIQDNISVIRK